MVSNFLPVTDLSPLQGSHSSRQQVQQAILQLSWGGEEGVESAVSPKGRGRRTRCTAEPWIHWDREGERVVVEGKEKPRGLSV